MCAVVFVHRGADLSVYDWRRQQVDIETLLKMERSVAGCVQPVPSIVGWKPTFSTPRYGTAQFRRRSARLLKRPRHSTVVDRSLPRSVPSRSRQCVSNVHPRTPNHTDAFLVPFRPRAEVSAGSRVRDESTLTTMQVAYGTNNAADLSTALVLCVLRPTSVTTAALICYFHCLRKRKETRLQSTIHARQQTTQWWMKRSPSEVHSEMVTVLPFWFRLKLNGVLGQHISCALPSVAKVKGQGQMSPKLTHIRGHQNTSVMLARPKVTKPRTKSDCARPRNVSTCPRPDQDQCQTCSRKRLTPTATTLRQIKMRNVAWSRLPAYDRA